MQCVGCTKKHDSTWKLHYYQKHCLTPHQIIDFVIWQLFYRTYRNVHKPLHLLCHGYQRASAPQRPNEEHCVLAHIHGIVSHFPNGHVGTMKNETWADVLGLLGKGDDWIMRDLILDCGIFVSVDSGKGNYYQLSGTYQPLTLGNSLAYVLRTGRPLTELRPILSRSIVHHPLQANKTAREPTEPQAKPQQSCKSPADITFVRNRMFYARAALNAKGRVRFGLRHIRKFSGDQYRFLYR